MSAPVPLTSIKVEEQIPQKRKLVNEFVVDENGSSASRTCVMPNGQHLIFTVYFPKKCNDDQRNKRLSNFTKESLEKLGQCALDLGLTKPCKKGIPAWIVFHRDEKGLITSFEKNRKDSDNPAKINEEYYKNKITINTSVIAKKTRFESKLKKFQDIQRLLVEIS